MPTIFRWNGYRFFFFSNEGVPLEPLHVHVQKAEALAKFWIDPSVELDFGYNLSSTELRRLKAIVEENEGIIRDSWNEYFG